MRFQPHGNPNWWRNAVRKAGGSLPLAPEETDRLEAMRRIAKAEAECARKKLAASIICTHARKSLTKTSG